MDLLEEVALDHGKHRAALAIVARQHLGRAEQDGKQGRREDELAHRIALPLPRIWPRQTKPISA